MRPWDWIVLAAIAEGTLALVLAVLVQRRTRYGSVTERRSLGDRASEPDDEDEEPVAPRSFSLRRRRRAATRGQSGELSVRVVPLSSTARDRYLRQWHHFRAEFVEEPHRTAERTDGMVQDLMFDRGFPLEDLEDPELQVALEHQVVVENYRIAHRLAEGGRRANTEQLRLAMLHYRVVLEELLEEPPFDLEGPRRKARRRRKAPAQAPPDIDRYRVDVTDHGPQVPPADNRETG
jgi:hypothetical protein